MEFVKIAGPAGMFFIMFSLALSIKTSAFKAIASNPLSFYLGLVTQLIGMPLIGFIIALTIPFPVEVKVGIVLITCLPSAVTSNFLTKKIFCIYRLVTYKNIICRFSNFIIVIFCAPFFKLITC